MITEDDYNTYRCLLQITHAHKRNFDLTKPINANRSLKYNMFIKPLLNDTKSGSGMNVNGFKYEHWDDPNELVDRLRLLVSSQMAGHTGHNNEILSIIEELKEGNIII